MAHREMTCHSAHQALLCDASHKAAQLRPDIWEGVHLKEMKRGNHVGYTARAF